MENKYIEILLGFIYASELVKKKHYFEYELSKEEVWLMNNGYIEVIPSEIPDVISEISITQKGVLELLENEKIELPYYTHLSIEDDIDHPFVLAVGGIKKKEELEKTRFGSNKMFEILKEIYPNKMYVVKKQPRETIFQVSKVYSIKYQSS